MIFLGRGCINMAKVLFQAYLEIEQVEFIENKAKETKRSRASIVRELIENEMDKDKKRG